MFDKRVLAVAVSLSSYKAENSLGYLKHCV